MKKITILLLLTASLLNAQVDNVMSYVVPIYPNKTDTLSVNFTYLKDTDWGGTNFLTQARGDSIIKYMYNEQMRDTTGNIYVFRAFFNSWWGGVWVNTAIGGSYNYATYDSSMYGLWNLIQSNNILAKNEGEKRMLHELEYTNVAALLEDTCISFRINVQGTPVVGILKAYSQSEGWAYLNIKSGEYGYYVYYYALCKAVGDELNLFK